MLRDLTHERLAVRLGHPVLGLDEISALEQRVELGLVPRFRQRAWAGLGDSSPLGCGRSMACVYMLVLRSVRPRGPVVDHALGLADRNALDGVGIEHLHAGGDADVALDVMMQLVRDGVAIRVAHFLAELDAHRERVQVPLLAEDQQVVGRQRRHPADQLLDLRGEHVHAADDEHVVGAAGDLVDAAHRARSRRQQPGEVARAVADHRQRLLGERGEHQLARRCRPGSTWPVCGSTISG